MNDPSDSKNLQHSQGDYMTHTIAGVAVGLTLLAAYLFALAPMVHLTGARPEYESNIVLTGRQVTSTWSALKAGLIFPAATLFYFLVRAHYKPFAALCSGWLMALSCLLLVIIPLICFLGFFRIITLGD